MTTEPQVVGSENSQVADANDNQDNQQTTMLLDGLPENGEPQAQAHSVNEGDKGEAGAKGENAPAKPEGAPESYEFVAPEGKAFDPGILDVFSGVAKELNLPQDKAQMVLDKMAPIIEQQQMAQIEAVRAAWAEQTRADQEIGGANLKENLAVAKLAVDKFASPDLKELLRATGLGDNPAVIRHFYRVGKAISEDSIVNSGEPSPATPRSAASILYGNDS